MQTGEPRLRFREGEGESGRSMAPGLTRNSRYRARKWDAVPVRHGGPWEPPEPTWPEVIGWLGLWRCSAATSGRFRGETDAHPQRVCPADGHPWPPARVAGHAEADMAGVRLKVEVRGLDATLRGLDRLAAAGRDLTPAMRDIGEHLLRTTRDRFDTQEAADGTP